MNRLPPLPSLHTFLITARACNFTRAAEQLHITQGAVSRQIANLEEHLGCRLFVRQPRGLALTDQGRELLPRIAQVFGLIEEAVEQVKDRGGAIQLKAPVCAMRWLWPRLMRWQDEHPDLPVELTTTIQYGVDFRHEPFDVALVYGRDPGEGVQARHLFEEWLTPVCAPRLLAQRPELGRLEGLADAMLLHPTRTDEDWRAWLAAAGGDIALARRGQHFESMDLAMGVAARGQGVAMGDPTIAAAEMEDERLVTPFELRVATGASYWLVAPRGRSQSPALQALLDWLATQ